MPTTKGVVGVLVAGGVVLAGLVGQARALTITYAALSNGIVTVMGGGAPASTSIRWEGQPAAVSTGRGHFVFATSNVPADCVGAVSDGVVTVQVPIRGCSVGVASLLRTGQTGCWDIAGNPIPCAGTRQDGDIRAGAPLRYTSHPNGTITDNHTGLVWEKKTAANMLDAYFWDDAFDYVASLNAAQYGGYTDWRLPNIRELASLIDYSRFDPAVAPEFNDCAGGSCTVSGSYWSSTSNQSAPFLAWRVNFNDGAHLVGGKGFTIRVRAVRGGL